MPNYIYQCKKCDHSFEQYQKFSENPLISCPSCKKKSLERLISGGLAAFVANRTVGVIADKNTDKFSLDYKKNLADKNKTKKVDKISEKLSEGQKLEKPTEVDPSKVALNKKLQKASKEAVKKYIETGNI